MELSLALANEFKIDPELINEKIIGLPQLALRMETFEGIDGNSIINDTYNLDALTQSLEYQYSVADLLLNPKK